MEQLQAVIVGASHAGGQLAANLRQNGWTGSILMIGDEPILPYHRPPLSKGYLSGQTSLSELLIRSADFYEKQNIIFRCAQVSSINRQNQRLELQDGSTVAYDKLALCLGARPRKLSSPHADLAGVHELRSARDIENIKATLDRTRHAVIIGGGYIGLETAASLRTLGIDVTVLESANRVLQRVTAPQVSGFYTRVHQEAGVDIRTEMNVRAIIGHRQVSGVECSDGSFFPADLVIVGIGVQPNVELAEAAGLNTDNGILINGQCLTNDVNIVAAGDCANHYSTRYGRRIRLESVPNTTEHAKVAAATLCNKPAEIRALPWFWSDQFDLKLQIAGLSQGYDSVVIRGDVQNKRSFSCFYFQEDQLIAADCINRPQEFLFSKKVILEQTPVDKKLLADDDTPITAVSLAN